MTTVRVFPGPKLVAATAVYGRSYSPIQGTAIDVPESDARVLTSNGWIWVALSGPTTSRPTADGQSVFSAKPGGHFFDSTLGKLLVYSGTAWIDPATGGAV